MTPAEVALAGCRRGVLGIKISSCVESEPVCINSDGFRVLFAAEEVDGCVGRLANYLLSILCAMIKPRFHVCLAVVDWGTLGSR